MSGEGRFGLTTEVTERNRRGNANVWKQSVCSEGLILYSLCVSITAIPDLLSLCVSSVLSVSSVVKTAIKEDHSAD
jgi:hypothetical protein